MAHVEVERNRHPFSEVATAPQDQDKNIEHINFSAYK